MIGDSKAQGSLEYLVIIVAVLSIAAVIVYFISGTAGVSVSAANFAECRKATSQCGSVHLLNAHDPCNFCEKACTVNGVDILNSSGDSLVSAVQLCKQGNMTLIYEGSNGSFKFKNNSQNIGQNNSQTQNSSIACSSDADCNDNNSCTADSCISNHCYYSNLDYGSSCDNGVGMCKNGVCVDCIDLDNDGYGVNNGTSCLYQGFDCNDKNQDIHPNVKEICNNGVDDNCNSLTDDEDSECPSISYLSSFNISTLPESSNPSYGDYLSSIQLVGNYVYLSTNNHGPVILNVTNKSNPEAVASNPNYPSYASFVSNNYDFCLRDNSPTFVVFNVTDHTLHYAGYANLPNASDDIFVSGNYAYVADTNDHLLVIVNVSGLDNSPTTVRYYLASDYPTKVFVSGDYAYVLGYYKFYILNVSDKTNPQLISNTSSSHYDNLYVSNNYAYLIERYVPAGTKKYERRVDILNITNKSNPEVTAFLNKSCQTFFVSGNYFYARNNSYDDKTSTAHMTLSIINIEDKRNPYEIYTKQFNVSRGWPPLSMYVAGDYIYTAPSSLNFSIFKVHIPQA